MVSTRVGYAGGTTPNPSYYRLGDHSETVQIEYNPARISYGELLRVFWNSHNPVYEASSRQYMSIIFYHNDGQRRLAIETKEQEEREKGRRVFTDIVPAGSFYLAEDYHQKHFLRQVPEIMRELAAIYPDINDFVASTAVARVNAYLAGYGLLEDLKEEVGSFGFTSHAEAVFVEIAAHRVRSPTCSLR